MVQSFICDSEGVVINGGVDHSIVLEGMKSLFEITVGHVSLQEGPDVIFVDRVLRAILHDVFHHIHDLF